MELYNPKKTKNTIGYLCAGPKDRQEWASTYGKISELTAERRKIQEMARKEIIGAFSFDQKTFLIAIRLQGFMTHLLKDMNLTESQEDRLLQIYTDTAKEVVTMSSSDPFAGACSDSVFPKLAQTIREEILTKENFLAKSKHTIQQVFFLQVGKMDLTESQKVEMEKIVADAAKKMASSAKCVGKFWLG